VSEFFDDASDFIGENAYIKTEAANQIQDAIDQWNDMTDE
jgi:hypothetical protein